MAFIFQTSPVATIKARSATSTETFTINGVTTDTTTVINAANQINKILAIGDKAIAGDEYMSRVLTEEVIDDE